MPRDLNARRDSYRTHQLDEQTKRYVRLEESVTGLVDEIIEKVFPENESGALDFIKFDWTRAQELEQMLRTFRDGGNRQQNSRPAVRPAQQPVAQPAAAVAPATPVTPLAPLVIPEPPAATPDDDVVPGLQTPTDEPSKGGAVKRLGKKLSDRLNS